MPEQCIRSITYMELHQMTISPIQISRVCAALKQSQAQRGNGLLKIQVLFFLFKNVQTFVHPTRI